MAIVGSPEDCREKLQDFARAGVTDFALLLGGNAPELMRCFAQAVISRWSSLLSRREDAEFVEVLWT